MAYKIKTYKSIQNLRSFNPPVTSSILNLDQADPITNQTEIFSEPESNLQAAEVAGVGIELPQNRPQSLLYSTNIPLKKDVYSCKGAREELDEEFTEFNILNLNYKRFFDLHDRFFYSKQLMGEQNESHHYFLNESIKYIGGFINPRIAEIEELTKELNNIQIEIDSIEKKHPFIPNGKIICREIFRDNISLAINQSNIYYMQSGKKRNIENPDVYHGLKNRLTPGSTQENNITDDDFIIFLDSLDSIPTGPPITVFDDIYNTPVNIEYTNMILYINRYNPGSNITLENGNNSNRPII
jgi:hypothetical protein